jgi:glucosamine-6-phosphate deaminase
MNTIFSSQVERIYHEKSKWSKQSTNIPYIAVDNFPQLGLLTSLRFLEWVAENPNEVISLPTGKTPEYFIKYTNFLLQNWDNEK